MRLRAGSDVDRHLQFNMDAAKRDTSSW
jgi:hypothetical protein